MAPSTSPIRVLIADDHRFFRLGLRRACELEGFEIVGEAENGQEAVELARHTRPDVILMDIEMPVLDGVRATGLIVKEHPAVKVIMLTTHQHDSTVRAALKVGACDYLSKDVDEHVLIETIRVTHRGEGHIPVNNHRDQNREEKPE
jgi:DNA-binding NarL/FixJ family response regulator